METDRSDARPSAAWPEDRLLGYASASQFSREYGRYFGESPSRDVAKLRDSIVRSAPD